MSNVYVSLWDYFNSIDLGIIENYEQYSWDDIIDIVTTRYYEIPGSSREKLVEVFGKPGYTDRQCIEYALDISVIRD